MTKKYAMVLGLGVALAAGAGVMAVRAADEDTPAAADVKKLADEAAKKDWADLTKAAEPIAKKHELLDIMTVFKLRKPGAKTTGVGVGNQPGAIKPDGIEAKILNLSKNVQPADMAKAADLKRMAEIAAAVAGIAKHLPNDSAKKAPGGTKKWEQYSKEMHDAARDLAKSLEGKNRTEVKAAAKKLNDSCTKCHSDYRDE